MNITQVKSVTFRVGANITIGVTSDSNAAPYFYHHITSISGSGAMYNNIDSAVCIEYPEIKWGNFWANTLTIFSEPGVSQGDIVIPSGVTTIANGFLNGFYFTSLTLPEGLTSIGDKAFGPHDNVENGRSPITSLVIPSTVTHIGKSAFANQKYLENITILNENYQIETYTGNVYSQIFGVGLNTGTNNDEHGCFITNLVASDDIKRFDWYNVFNRKIDQLANTILRLRHNNKVIEINGYNEGLLPFEHKGHTYWMKECQNGAANQSPLVIKHKGEIHYISK